MLAPDAHLANYRLIERIGAGGMGEVWKAEDTRLGRIVAIKILPSSVADNAEAAARMRREARMAAQLNHPNIATVHATLAWVERKRPPAPVATSGGAPAPSPAAVATQRAAEGGGAPPGGAPLAAEHLRLGSAALVKRDFTTAAAELNAALADAHRLTPHEQALARLALAIANRDRVRATEIARAIELRWPNDPAVARLHREFPGTIMARRRGRP